ncbi:hypothetical protein GCM10027440_52810 [Nocardiopsis coralliicola]
MPFARVACPGLESPHRLLSSRPRHRRVRRCACAAAGEEELQSPAAPAPGRLGVLGRLCGAPRAGGSPGPGPGQALPAARRPPAPGPAGAAQTERRAPERSIPDLHGPGQETSGDGGPPRPPRAAGPGPAAPEEPGASRTGAR